MAEINFKAIERKWQKAWADANIFVADDNSKKSKYYVLEMFPYPSGSGLHMGHAWNYTIGDIVARFKRMEGFEVLHPMGFDALGLPAENAAIKDGTHPEDYTNKSIKTFIRQMKELGTSYDWTRQINSASPEYYKWDQWIFLKMLKKGLAYQKESNVNWCPSCATVLANEQAQNGVCDRCGTKVEIKRLTQWFLKITDYAEELYEGIDKLEDWPARTKSMQKHWIGKSNGAEIDFEVNGKKWPVFTTRADTIFGVTFVVVAGQHPKLWDLVTEEQKSAVEEFVKGLKTVSEKDMADMKKEGVFTGSYAINPANNEKVPIYAGNFVVADYGSGMVMAVPAHDQRDMDFARKMILNGEKIDIKFVIIPDSLDDLKGYYTGKNPEEYLKMTKSMILAGSKCNYNNSSAYNAKGKLINSGEFNGLSSDEAKKKIITWLEKQGKGRNFTNFRLRDWGISRQRYWGTPIPIIHCPSCGAVPVPEKDLPVELPKNVKFGEGNPLETNEEWLNVPCPKCGKMGRREADTMDTFVNSSWYFTRYCDPKNAKEIFDKEKVKTWCPVDIYVGGAEHACMHLIYSRFYTKFLRDIGLVEFDEPAKKLFHQGMLHAEDGSKMSKSKNNGILPEEVSDKYGIDTARFFLSSLASPDKDIDWSEKGIVGSLRFIGKIFDFVKNFNPNKDSEKLEILLNNVVKNITEYYNNFQYRKATIELRELFDLMSNEGCSKETVDKFLKMINPICPHITEELWEKLGNSKFISISEWPSFDKNKLKINKKKEDFNAKIISIIKPHIKKIECKKVYLYVIPFQRSEFDSSIISKELAREVVIYSVDDENKYDPQNKAKKSRPGMPSFFLE